MRRGDDVHFISEDDHPSLLALLWQYGAPVVMLSLTLVALVLWRGGVRFGPLAAAPDAARRSLAEQIRGTGQFALRHGGGNSLHAASVRALDEAAQTPDSELRAVCPPSERAAALARLTGLDRDALAAAVQHVRRAPIPRAPQHDRADRGRAAPNSSASTQGSRMEHIETDAIPQAAGAARRSARGHRSGDGRAVGGRSNRCWWRSSRRGTS